MGDTQYRILIIDDNPEDRLLYRRLLKGITDLRFEFIEAETGREGLDRLHREKIDCALLDYRLPDMDGIELLTELRKDHSLTSIPLVFLTGQGNETIAVNAMKKGATDYLVKSVLTQDFLGRTIQYAIEKKAAEKALQQKTDELQQSVQDLEKANLQIIEHQKALIEEERLKVLLQMAGATAHELNQPLMVLLGNIQLLEMHRENPEKIVKYIKKIEVTGQHIAEIVKKIQTIRHHEVRDYPGEERILKIDQTITILAIEDTDDDYNALQKILGTFEHFCLLRAKDFDQAFQLIQNESIDLIFLEYLLPSGTGIEFLIEIDAKNIDIPVVVVNGQKDEMVASRAIQAGAYDYLPKSKLSATSLSRIISNVLEKFRLKQDVKKAVTQMAKMSLHDELTGLCNRSCFMEALERETNNAERYQTELALCILDVDHFKNIHDTYGYPAGDEVLKALANLLKSNVRKNDIACRYGGKEFAVIFPNTSIHDAKRMCERFKRQVEHYSIPYLNENIHITVSIGIAKFSAGTQDLLKTANQALDQARSNGHNRVVSM